MIISGNQVMLCLQQGMTSSQIAEKYKVSVRTVEYRREKLMKRFKAKTPLHLGYLVGKST